jgi:hypothetical protein
MKAFDVEGKEIEVFSQEELDAKLKEFTEKTASEKADADAKAAADKAAADAAAAAAGGNSDEVPAWAKPIIDTVNSLKSNHTQTYVERVATGLDADRRKLVETKFATLTTGYEETPEGMARRAEDAYLLATGEKFNAGTVNVQNLMSSGNGGRTQTDNKVVTETDKEIQSALGITSADAEKFAKKN